jgi:hypothetical protein
MKICPLTALGFRAGRSSGSFQLCNAFFVSKRHCVTLLAAHFTVLGTPSCLSTRSRRNGEWSMKWSLMSLHGPQSATSRRNCLNYELTQRIALHCGNDSVSRLSHCLFRMILSLSCNVSLSIAHAAEIENNWHCIAEDRLGRDRVDTAIDLVSNASVFARGQSQMEAGVEHFFLPA